MALTLDQEIGREKGEVTQRVKGPDLPSLPGLTSHIGPFVNNPRKQQFLVDSINVIKVVLETEVQSVAEGRHQSDRTGQGQGSGARAEPQPVWFSHQSPSLIQGLGAGPFVSCTFPGRQSSEGLQRRGRRIGQTLA